MDPDSIARCIPLILLILCGGFFASSETALSYCSHIKIKQLSESGSRRARRVEKVLDRFDRALVTILIGTNVCYVAAASVGLSLFYGLCGRHSYVPALSTVVVTLAVFIFAETIPKNIARANSDKYAMTIAAALSVFMFVLTPVTFVFTKISDFLKKILPHGKEAPTYTEDEIQDLVEDAREDEVLEEEESEIIRNSVEFGDISAKEVLCPLENVSSVCLLDKREDLIAKLIECNYSRVPVYKTDPKRFTGVLRASEFLLACMRNPNADVRKYVMQPLYITPETKLSTAFEEMGKRKIHMAIVREGTNGDPSAQRRIVGILTMEDILEEIVGEIYDEDDASEPEDAAGREADV